MNTYQTSQTVLWWFTFRNWFAIGIAVFLLALILTLSLLLTKRSLNSQQFTPLNCYAKSAVAEYAGKCSDNCYAKAAVAADAEVCSEIGRYDYKETNLCFCERFCSTIVWINNMEFA